MNGNRSSIISAMLNRSKSEILILKCINAIKAKKFVISFETKQYFS